MSEQTEEAEYKIRTKQIPISRMDAEDAIMQMELSDHDFFAYVDAETNEMAIVYRQKDSDGYGRIELTRA